MNSSDIKSYLSPNVKYLLCDAGITSELNPDALDASGLLNWTTVQAALSEEEQETTNYYIHSVAALRPIINSVEQFYMTFEGESFQNYFSVYEKYTKWTSVPQLALSLAKTLKQYHAHNKKEILEWMLVVFTLFERSLGGVFLCKGQQCPSLLKDLLQTQELRSLLTPTVIQLLRILIGPPISLNLRNIVWHGFPIPGEVTIQYAYFMMCLLPSIGKVLEDSGITIESIVHRPFVTFPQVISVTTDMMVETVDQHIDKYRRLIEISNVVIPSMKPMWELGLQRYISADYGRCAAIVLPQLETVLRYLYATANNCPGRILTAQSSAFFTTFDEILVKQLPDGCNNNLQTLITPGVFSCLLDLLQYPEGPRIRDKLSHGEVDIARFPKHIASHIMYVCFSVLNLCSKNHHLPDIPNSVMSLDTYESMFHPVSVLKQSLLESASRLSQWKLLPRPRAGDIDVCFDWHKDETLQGLTAELEQCVVNIRKFYTAIKEEERVTVFKNSFGDLIKDLVLSERVETLFRYSCVKSNQTSGTSSNPAPNESEVIGILRRIVQNVNEISVLIAEVLETRYQQWLNKELRSRQRNTYRRMLDSVPYISCGLRLIVLAVTGHYISLDSYDTHTKRVQFLKIYKHMLQYCENVKNNSTLDRNRWEESVSLTKNLMKNVAAL